uniref:Monoglyceride lipase n=1 Tax=Solanum tuberosum TaxID=4113 RepID=M1B5Q9_SOLTU
MDLALTTTFRPSIPPESSLFHRKTDRPIILRHKWKWQPQTSTSETKGRTITMALKKAKIDGVSEALNEIASQNLDHAPARRRVRSAFVNAQQQLDHILFKMAPGDIRLEEWYETNSKGQQIFCKSWLPKPGIRIKGALCFSHGYGDTCTFFFEGIAKHIAAAGYAVYAIDHPGFGLSDGLHGYIPEFDGIVDNVNEQYVKIKSKLQ